MFQQAIKAAADREETLGYGRALGLAEVHVREVLTIYADVATQSGQAPPSEWYLRSCLLRRALNEDWQPGWEQRAWIARNLARIAVQS